MRAAIYIRVGNPDQVTIQPQKEALTGQSRGCAERRFKES